METIKKELLADPKEVIRENLRFLREYARRLLMEEDDALVAIEDFKDVLMQEFLTVGKSLKLTERDMMVLLFRGITGQMRLGAIITQFNIQPPHPNPLPEGEWVGARHAVPLPTPTFRHPSPFGRGAGGEGLAFCPHKF